MFDAVRDRADAFLDHLGSPFRELAGAFGGGLPVVEANAECSRPVRAPEAAA